MRISSLVPLLVLAAVSAADASKAWKSEHKTLGRAERRYKKGFKKAFKDAYQEWNNSRDRQANNPVYDFAPLRRIYEDYAAIQVELGKADVRFGESGHPKAHDLLIRELDDVCKRLEKLDGELRKGKVVVDEIHDQWPAVQSYGLWHRRDLLVDALAQGDGASDFLLEAGWTAAAKRDGRRSTHRRVAVLDALGKASGAAGAVKKMLWKQLAPGEPAAVRVAAVEALLVRGEAPTDVLDDAVRAVRRAAARGANKPEWIGALVRKLRTADGVLRGDLVKSLATLTKQTFGDDPKAWAEWYSVYEDEIAKGKFDLENVEVQEAKPKPVASVGAFYGIPLESSGVIFVVDGSWRIHTPARVETQHKKKNWRWRQEVAQWSDNHESHKKVVRREFGRAAAEAPPEFLLGFVSLYGSNQIGEKQVAKVSKKSIRGGDRFLEKLAADGWTAPHVGLLHAADLAAKDREVDTIVLFTGGRPAGGPFVYAKAAVNDWQRRNRARGLTVHTVRIVDDGDEAENYMKGLAEASAGTYVWAKEPPSLRK